MMLLTAATAMLFGRSRRFRRLVPALPIAVAAYRHFTQRAGTAKPVIESTAHLEVSSTVCSRCCCHLERPSIPMRRIGGGRSWYA